MLTVAKVNDAVHRNKNYPFPAAGDVGLQLTASTSLVNPQSMSQEIGLCSSSVHPLLRTPLIAASVALRQLA